MVAELAPATGVPAPRTHPCRGCRDVFDESGFRKSRLAARSYLCRRCEGETQRQKRALMRQLLREHRATHPTPKRARPPYERAGEEGGREILCMKCDAWKAEAAFGRPYAQGKTPPARLPCVACKNLKARAWREKQREIRDAHRRMLAELGKRGDAAPDKASPTPSPVATVVGDLESNQEE
eukprot:tig00020553_g10522.t1